jgi:hypothetical protein
MMGFATASWFETREDALLTMRAWGLILRSIANGSRECAPDDRLRDASRRMKPLNPKTRYSPPSIWRPISAMAR